jgi:hypothetical protein
VERTEATMNVEQFREIVRPVIDFVDGRELGLDLTEALEREFPPESDTFRAIEKACHEAIEAGWMCAEGEGGRRFGRVIEAGPDTAGFSVDVVDLADIVGPHHRHPTGEICMIMPLDKGARFDGKGAGWTVYPPRSAHFPTVTDGEALVLYMLPEGQIEFTGKKYGK